MLGNQWPQLEILEGSLAAPGHPMLRMPVVMVLGTEGADYWHGPQSQMGACHCADQMSAMSARWFMLVA